MYIVQWIISYLYTIQKLITFYNTFYKSKTYDNVDLNHIPTQETLFCKILRKGKDGSDNK